MTLWGVAVIGTGFGKQVHIPGFQACAQMNVIGVWHHKLSQAQAVAQQFNLPYAFDRIEDVLAHPAVQVVAIASPPFLHYPMARAALEAGKHILLEKPVTLTYTEARELYDLARRQNVVAAVDFEFRYVPAWRYFADLLQSRKVGKIRLVQVEWLVQGRANPSRSWNWYSQKALGGGALGALGSHVFDYLTWLFGGITHLSGNLSTAIPQRPDAQGVLRDVDADDTCTLHLELQGGVPCSVAISTVTYGGRGHWLTVYGEEGTLVLGSPNLSDYVHGFRLHFAPGGGALELLPVPPSYALSHHFDDGRLAPFIALAQDFRDTIGGKVTPLPTLRQGMHSQLLMDLTHQSHHDRCWVRVPMAQDD